MPQTHQQDRKRESNVPKATDDIQKSAKKDLAGQDFASQEAALVPPVQMREAPGRGGQDVQAAAQHGVKGGGQALPHIEQIQASFGDFDVSQIQAHVGGQASEASDAMGAEAYATGNDVAFKRQPDVFTAAHEAAHIVQQQAGVQLEGGVGRAGDHYERQADAVAQKVVAGESAESLLGGGSTQTSAAPVQHTGKVQKEETPGALAPAKVQAAIAFNQGKGIKAADWAIIAGIVGSSSTALNATLVKAIAAWQAAQGMSTADGKCGDTTLSWLAQESGGESLEAYVKSNNILYVGMNPSSKNLEHNKLVGQGANVTAVKGDAKQGNAKVNGRNMDLGTEDGLNGFLDSLAGLDPGRRDQIKAFIEKADFAAKDEIAQIVTHLWKCERGEALIKRVVLSGHSGGWSFWGDDNGNIPFEDLEQLATLFPHATGCVRDVMLSACNTGQNQKLAQYQRTFRNATSIWAYVGYSPSAATGALTHVGNWEQATRGPLNQGGIDAAREKTARGSGSKDKNVAVWTKGADGKETYKTSSPEAAQSFETLKALVDSGMALYNTAMAGTIDKQGLSTFYVNLQMLLGNFAHRLPNADELDTVLKQTLFLRYWENVTTKFMGAYGAKVKAGYDAAGARMPAYAGAARGTVLGWVSSYPKQGDEGHGLLQQYLVDLDPTVLPPTWA